MVPPQSPIGVLRRDSSPEDHRCDGLQRTNPVESAKKYNQMFSELVVLEAKGKELHTRSIGAAD